MCYFEMIYFPSKHKKGRGGREVCKQAPVSRLGSAQCQSQWAVLVEVLPGTITSPRNLLSGKITRDYIERDTKNGLATHVVINFSP